MPQTRDQFKVVCDRMVHKIRSTEGLRYNGLTKNEKRLVDYLAKRKRVTLTYLEGQNDWIVS